MVFSTTLCEKKFRLPSSFAACCRTPCWQVCLVLYQGKILKSSNQTAHNNSQACIQFTDIPSYAWIKALHKTFPCSHVFRKFIRHSWSFIKAFHKTFPAMHPSSFQDSTVIHPCNTHDIPSHEFLHFEEVPTMHLWQKAARIFHSLVTMTSLFSALFALAFKNCDAV